MTYSYFLYDEAGFDYASCRCGFRPQITIGRFWRRSLTWK